MTHAGRADEQRVGGEAMMVILGLGMGFAIAGSLANIPFFMFLGGLMCALVAVCFVVSIYEDPAQ